MRFWSRYALTTWTERSCPALALRVSHVAASSCHSRFEVSISTGHSRPGTVTCTQLMSPVKGGRCAWAVGSTHSPTRASMERAVSKGLTGTGRGSALARDEAHVHFGGASLTEYVVPCVGSASCAASVLSEGWPFASTSARQASSVASPP